jgi:hypothetical protein
VSTRQDILQLIRLWALLGALRLCRMARHGLAHSYPLARMSPTVAAIVNSSRRSDRGRTERRFARRCVFRYGCRYVRPRTGDGRHGCCHDDRRSGTWSREFEKDSLLALGYLERGA